MKTFRESRGNNHLATGTLRSSTPCCNSKFANTAVSTFEREAARDSAHQEP